MASRIAIGSVSDCGVYAAWSNAMTRKIPLSVQIQEVKTELHFRGQVYPRQIQQAPRKKSELEYRVEIMQAVQATLEWLFENEDEVREFVAQKRKKTATPEGAAMMGGG